MISIPQLAICQQPFTWAELDNHSSVHYRHSMHRPVVTAFAVIISLGAAAGRVRAQSAPTPEASAAHCRYIEANAAGERALLLSPQLFGRVGLVPVGERDQAADLLDLEPRLRLTVGLEYSVSDLWRGHLVGRAAQAECRRARAQEAIDAALYASDSVGRIEALAARQSALERSMPEAERRLADVRALVVDRVLTDQDLVAIESQVQKLRAARHDATREREALETARWEGAEAGRRPVSRLVGDLVAAELAVEEVHSDQRRARAWELSLSAGADSVDSGNLAAAPFALVRVQFNFGYLKQDRAAQRARNALVDRARMDQRAARAHAQRLRDGLSSAHATAKAELADRREFLVGIAERIELLAQLDTARSRLHQNVLWFTRAFAEADIAYFEAYLAAVEAYAAQAFVPDELAGTSFRVAAPAP